MSMAGYRLHSSDSRPHGAGSMRDRPAPRQPYAPCVSGRSPGCSGVASGLPPLPFVPVLPDRHSALNLHADGVRIVGPSPVFAPTTWAGPFRPLSSRTTSGALPEPDRGMTARREAGDRPCDASALSTLHDLDGASIPGPPRAVILARQVFTRMFHLLHVLCSSPVSPLPVISPPSGSRGAAPEPPVRPVVRHLRAIPRGPSILEGSCPRDFSPRPQPPSPSPC